MARYFFHLVDGVSTLFDEEGVTLEPHQISVSALRQARSVIAADAAEGIIDLRYCIEVRDEAAEVIYSLPFSEAVKIAASPV